MSAQRDAIRAKILGLKPRSIPLTVAGVDVEMRQPQVQDIIFDGERTRKDTVVNMLVNYTYVPGTDEKVFEPEDAEVLLEMPFGADYQALQEAINTLTNMGEIHTAEVGNSNATSAESQSSESPTL